MAMEITLSRWEKDDDIYLILSDRMTKFAIPLSEHEAEHLASKLQSFAKGETGRETIVEVWDE